MNYVLNQDNLNKSYYIKLFDLRLGKKKRYRKPKFVYMKTIFDVPDYVIFTFALLLSVAFAIPKKHTKN